MKIWYKIQKIYPIKEKNRNKFSKTMKDQKSKNLMKKVKRKC